jgi:Xaa-Pro dipeptidase
MALEAEIQAHRLATLRATMRDAGLDAVAIVPGANQHYLIGSHFHLMERPTVLIVPLEGEMRMVLPALEKPDWDRLDVPARVHIWQDMDGSEAAFAAAVSDLGARRIGVEGQRMRVFEMMALRAHANAEIEDAQKPISRMRLSKDASEIALLRQAIELSEAGLARTLAEVRVGMTERQVNNILLTNLFSLGAEGLSFPPIVVTGANAALPHAAAGDTVIAAGDTLLFDFGATKGGYNADITRTVFVGEPADEARALYETVLAANARGREITRPGVTAHNVDDAVTKVLEASPFARHILHKTGHGLGLDVHEDPQVMRGNHATLDVGHVITIEPGLYMPGVRGIRIEDDVVVTADGCESLTTFTRDLTVVG